jgi:DNA repair protein SbcC/Rad50
MRPLKLSLSGFSCFKEPTEINFADLELFAIVGQTGAGKSSILDGITYALFGETSRLGSKGLEALVSLGGNSMYAVLEFEAADGHVYKVSRVWSRKASEKALRFERLDGERWATAAEGVKIKEMESAIVRVVGLDFSGFTRAILLPQGEFDRFLRGNASERRELLKGLLGLERIELMMRRAGEIAREAKTRLEGIGALLNDASSITPEFIEFQREQLEGTTKALRDAQAALEANRLEVTAAREVLKLTGELDAVRRDLSAWQEKASEASLARERVVAARRVAAVTPVLTSLERAGKALSAARAETEKRRAQLEDIRARQASALERQQAAVTAALEIVDVDARITELNVVKPQLERLRSLGGALEDADPRFVWDETRFTQLEGLRNQLGLLRKLEKDAREVKQQQRALVTETEAARKELANTETRLERLKLEGTTLLETTKRLEADLDAARRENLVGQIVSGLEVGDPCPVCGEPLRALPDVGASRVPALEAELKAVQGELQERRSQYRAAQESVKLQLANLEKLEASSAQLEARGANFEAELLGLREEFRRAVGVADDPVSAVQEARAGLLAGLAAEVSQRTLGADVEAQIVALGRRKRQLEDAQRQAERALSETQAALSAAQTALENAEALLLERTDEAREWQAELETVLREAGCSSADEARGAALSETEIQRLETLERDFRDRLNTLRERELGLRETLGARRVTPEDFAALESAQRALEAQVREHTQAQGRLEQVIQDLQTRLRDKNRLIAESAALEKRFDVYQALSNDLKGNAFQDYLLSQVQRDLLARASSVMREVTRDRYILSLEDGEFSVRDAWNGMEPRSVRTLSGGESFIASLSLALALSDYLAGSKALGALFLDEGFGTLDSEALDAVASVLESLNTQGRTVGVITHVSALAERLPNRLMVEKSQASSRAYWSDV